MFLKKILVTQRIYLEPRYSELRECLDVRWSELLSFIGYLPIIISARSNINDFFDNISIDGILLTGGNDLGYYSQRKVDLMRDEVERPLIEYGVQHSIPILGVCRGMQMVAHYFGSSLTKVSNHVGMRHKIMTSKKSRFASRLQEIKTANSYHHYAVTELGKDLFVSAASSDNTIEAIEHRRLKVFGHMWHCERETPFVNAQVQLIKEFFA